VEEFLARFTEQNVSVHHNPRQVVTAIPVSRISQVILPGVGNDS